VAYGPFQTDYYGNALAQYQFGNKTWDYNTEGLAHVGLYPDFVADLQAIGLGNDLGPLFNSAEAYVKMWEKIDDRDPPTVQCGTVGDDWHAQDVAVPCNAYDTGYGLRDSAESSFTLTTSVPAGVETGDASTGTHAPICDGRGHCTATIPAIAGINVDKRAPAVVVNAPAAGTPTYTLNQTVLADFSCSDGGSGVAQCTGTVASGGALDTSLAAHAFTVKGVDGVANLTEVDRPYNVAFAICLLYDPAKPKHAGSTIPIKLQLCDATGANVSAPTIALTATGVTRTAANVTGAPEDAGNANPDSQFRFDSLLGGYIFNLSTKGLQTGVYDVSFTATGDPTPHTVQFQIR
jgi:hypothetical protein